MKKKRAYHAAKLPLGMTSTVARSVGISERSACGCVFSFLMGTGLTSVKGAIERKSTYGIRRRHGRGPCACAGRSGPSPSEVAFLP